LGGDSLETESHIVSGKRFGVRIMELIGTLRTFKVQYPLGSSVSIPIERELNYKKSSERFVEVRINQLSM